MVASKMLLVTKCEALKTVFGKPVSFSKDEAMRMMMLNNTTMTEMTMTRKDVVLAIVRRVCRQSFGFLSA